MSSFISGKVGPHQLEWLSFSASSYGSGKVRLGGQIFEVSWRVDSQGVWVEFPHGTFGFDCHAQADDEGKRSYELRSRQGVEGHQRVSFLRLGQELTSSESSQKKKVVRIKAQMPGKIVRLHVKMGDVVEKGQVLLVMEAMKMENPIRASQSGVISKVSVNEGLAVETGAELLILGD